MCGEQGVLSRYYSNNGLLRQSLRIKLFFLFNFVVLSAAFTGTMYQGVYGPSVILEWLLGLLLALYMWSCAIDFFAVPRPESGHASYDSDLRRLLAKEWDEEIDIAVPRKARSGTVHKHYIELP